MDTNIPKNGNPSQSDVFDIGFDSHDISFSPVASASTVISVEIGSSEPCPSWGGAVVVFPTIAPSVTDCVQVM